MRQRERKERQNQEEGRREGQNQEGVRREGQNQEGVRREGQNQEGVRRQRQTRQINFADGRILYDMAAMAGPMMVAQLLNLLYNIVDRIYIARIPHVGTAALGGVGLCFPVITIITAFTNLYGSGGAPLFSIARGRGDDPEAGKIMDSVFFLELFTAGLIMMTGWLFGRPVLQAFGASGEALAYSLPYLRIYLAGTFFAMLATGLNPFIVAQGFPRAAMATVMIGALANLVLDPLFIFVLGYGVRGAAIATVLSQALSALFILRFLLRGNAEIRLCRNPLRELLRGGRRIANIIGLGIASFVMMMTNSLVQITCNRVLSRTGGDVYITIMAIIASVRQVLELPIMAIADGAAPILSFHYGARRPELVRKAIFALAAFGIVYTLAVWGFIEWKPAFLISIFSSDAEILEDTMRALHLYFFAFPFMVFQYTGQTTFKSLNKKGRAIFFSLLRKAFIVVPLTYLLALTFHMGTDGVFLAEPVSNIVGGLACFITMLCTVLPELKRMEAG